VKLTLVVQRYGTDVVSGAERLCRGVAEGLAQGHDVEVLTTCAISYRTWANHFPAGCEEIAGVHVHRFRTERERDIAAFNELSERLFGRPHSRADETDWIEAQGPYAPGLVEHLHAVASDRDLVVLFTYLYHPTVQGVHVAPDRTVLVPTAHDEAPLYLPSYEAVFTLPAALIFNTRAEQRLVRARFPSLRQPQRVIGVGIEGLEALEDARSGGSTRGAAPSTLLYAGRIEAGKGVGELIDHVRAYRRERGTDLRLRLMGEIAMPIPEQPWIEALGFVDEATKVAHLAKATLLAAPSSLESFGIVLLEAMAAGTPVLANARSQAYVEHCVSSNGGLYYRGYEEFREALDILLGDTQLREAMAGAGSAYVREHYSWAAIVRGYEEFLGGIIQRRS